MTTNKMLIDASHPEETRVVVLRGNRVEEFDFESASRKQLRGNIYLAKVTRVEPSLQAAFVDFGGNRHGFLAFSEIHPDYYQIPVADREALLAEEARDHSRDQEEEDSEGGRRRRPPRQRRSSKAASGAPDETISESPSGEDYAEPGVTEGDKENRPASNTDIGAYGEVEDASPLADAPAETATETGAYGEIEDNPPEEEQAIRGARDEPQDEEEHIEIVGGGDALDEANDRQRRQRRHPYKIQEVIKRRQVLLVQVVKEERGTKGAALTTYLSLAGRYSVLMPNTARGGGISRKITNSTDRSRLKSVADELEVPEGMGVILRTAGASRTKPEIKRDFEYLLRVWETVRELTLQSSAPTLVYEEGSLVKRALRDLYSKEVEEIQVAGEEGYKEAKDFMRMLMPSHAKAVKPFRETQPLFARYGVETQLDAMFNNVVTLRSGGYLVINQTEALVAIDVNSGRSTREHNIEDTALKTNLEAAEEVARQLRLRDLAGLIVIDFIDMEESRNNKSVERKLKDCLKNDRARIQVGRISHFGLMEMSRQRIRTGVLESSTVACPHCQGSGIMRSTSSLSLHLVRAIEDTLLRNASHNLILRTRMEVALYVLNQKRSHVRALEDRFGVTITILGEEHLPGGQAFLMERGEPALGPQPGAALRALPVYDEPEDEDIVEETAEDDEVAAGGEPSPRADREEESGDERGPRKRRRRRRRGGRDREENGEVRATSDDAAPASIGGDEDDDEAQSAERTHADVTSGEADAASDDAKAGEDGQRRRRGRRGGRRNRRDRDEAGFPIIEDETGETAAAASEEAPVDLRGLVPTEATAAPAAEPPATEEVAAEEPAPKPRRRTRKPRRETELEAPPETDAEPTPGSPVADAAEDAPASNVMPFAKPERAAEPALEPEPDPVPSLESAPEQKAAKTPEPVLAEPLVEVSDPSKPARSGWWAKAKKAIAGEG